MESRLLGLHGFQYAFLERSSVVVIWETDCVHASKLNHNIIVMNIQREANHWQSLGILAFHLGVCVQWSPTPQVEMSSRLTEGMFQPPVCLYWIKQRLLTWCPPSYIWTTSPTRPQPAGGHQVGDDWVKGLSNNISRVPYYFCIY